MQNLNTATISCPNCKTVNKLPHTTISSVVSCYSCQHRFTSIIPPAVKPRKVKLVGYSKRFRGYAKESIFAVGLLDSQRGAK